MNFYVGVTDSNWFHQLSTQKVDEVNFWNPGGTSFRALKENELFLFKLHYPENAIVGGGFFVRFSLLPPSLAWQAFKEKNGTTSYDELITRIAKYRGRNGINENSQIGCTILTEPFWFDESDWIALPDWSKSIVKGKTFSHNTEEGQRLLAQVQERMRRTVVNQVVSDAPEQRYAESLTKHRLGQGGFRISVTDAYQRRCAITGEKTLPVLEAAHIMPYANEGPHLVSNGILLKSDFHTLFDQGYLTITPDYHIEVSKRLHEDYGNGKDYYQHHGQQLLILPTEISQMPDKKYIQWHNDNVYLG